jgi:hypothetical protein
MRVLMIVLALSARSLIAHLVYPAGAKSNSAQWFSCYSWLGKGAKHMHMCICKIAANLAMKCKHCTPSYFNRFIIILHFLLA